MTKLSTKSLMELSESLDRLGDIHSISPQGTVEFKIADYVKGQLDIPSLLLWLDSVIRESKQDKASSL